MRKILILFITIFLTICINGCNQSKAASEASTSVKTGQSAKTTLQQTAAPITTERQPEALPSTANVDLSYADANMFPEINWEWCGMVEDNSSVYYYSNAGISKQDKQTGKAKIIYYYKPLPVGDGIGYLSIYQNRLYFGQDSSIRSIDLNGGGLETLLDWNKYIEQGSKKTLQLLQIRDPIEDISVNNGLIYFDTIGVDNTDNINNILELNPTTGSLSIYIDNAENMVINGGYAYYYVHEEYMGRNVYEIYRMNIATKEKELVVGKDSPIINCNNKDGLSVGNFVFANGELYFIANPIMQSFPLSLYKCDNDGSIKELFTFDKNNIENSFEEYGGNIYFVDCPPTQEGNTQNYQKSILYELNTQTEKCSSLSILGESMTSYGMGIINNTVIYPSINQNKAGDSVMRYIDLKNIG